MMRKIYAYFSRGRNLAILNATLIAIIIGFNIYFQAFCIPTTWAIVLLAICFINTIFSPILEKTKWFAITSFINGITLFVFMYCIIFLGHMNMVGLVMILMGIGFATFIPHFFIVQLVWKNMIKPLRKKSRLYFVAAMIICTGIILYIRYDYQKAIHSIDEFTQNNYTELDKNFMTEKILGMHFIYHTRYCEYDGWRPPKHEPILVIGMWMNNRHDPLKVDLETRLELYKKFFPGNAYKFDCSCGIQYSKNYHDDKMWLK